MQNFSALIVEDDVAQSGLIKLYLEDAFGAHVSVHEADTMEAAEKLIGQHEFAVIIHDLYLPPWGPESVSQTYRISKGTPIIAVTGQTSPDLYRIAMANGASAFCSKEDLADGHISSIVTQVAPDLKQADNDNDQ
ncbi:MAG: response regulator [Alphaproteobacteria bacterium]